MAKSGAAKTPALSKPGPLAENAAPGPAAVEKPVAAISLSPLALDLLMPLHLRIAADGSIEGCGPTLAKLIPAARLIGRNFFATFTLKRPAGVLRMADLLPRAGQRLNLSFDDADGSRSFRGLALPFADGKGLLLNLTLGIGVIDAVQHFALNVGDFAPTDLTIEMLYLVEAKNAVMAEFDDLNRRLQEAKVMAERQALTDTLTGLKNRRALDLDFAWLSCGADPFCMMHLDLDFFKQVNDRYGHAAGDHVLRAVAQMLQDESRSGDTVARVGGDEFVLLMPGMTDRRVLDKVGRRIIDRVTQPIRFEEVECLISASIGVSISTSYPHPDAEIMAADADEALYASKRAGRGRIAFHHRDSESLVPEQKTA